MRAARPNPAATIHCLTVPWTGEHIRRTRQAPKAGNPPFATSTPAHPAVWRPLPLADPQRSRFGLWPEILRNRIWNMIAEHGLERAPLIQFTHHAQEMVQLRLLHPLFHPDIDELGPVAGVAIRMGISRI